MVRRETIFVDNKENELEVFATVDNTIRIHLKEDGSNNPMDWQFFDIEMEDIDELIAELNLCKDFIKEQNG
jgi:hypothetical protein